MDQKPHPRRTDDQGIVVSDSHDRGVDVEKLALEIEALRQAALRYAKAVAENTGAVGGAGLDLETAAICYVRKLDDEALKANRVDYNAIVAAAERDRENSDN
jgi:hypothetical protein